MKTVFPVMLFMLLLLLSSQASGSYWFQVVDVSPINLPPYSEANFTIAVKGLGSNGAYVELVFKNMTKGLEVSCPKMIKYVFPAGVTKYNCTLKSGDIAPGNYSFVVDVAAKGSPSGKKTAYVEVLGMNGRAAVPRMAAASNNTVSADNLTSAEAQSEKINQTASTSQGQSKGTPGPGAMLGALCLLLASRRRMN
jgi:hypothetical protein